MNFHLKRFHISRDTSEIVLHVIKQCLQAFYHHRNRFSKKLMVSAGVSWNGNTENFFIDPQKTTDNQKTYIDFLKTSLQPECRCLYPDNDFVFMQDSAPSYRAKATQNFLQNNTPDFISSREWTPHSPYLNPLDYSVLDILQELLYYEGRREPFANLEDLQNAIRDKWHDVDNQTVRTAILQWKRRLAAVAKQNGGPIQHIFC